MKISVIVTVYNEEKYLKQCLDSLAKQENKAFELIIVDDGSTDRTGKVLSAYQGGEIKYKIVKQTHQGLAAARNLGAKLAKGEILTFVDGDMYFSHTFLKDLCGPIMQGKTKGTYSINEKVANWENCWARAWNYNWNLPQKLRVNPKRIDQQQEFRAILKKEYEKVNGLDSIGYTDAWTLPKKLGYRPTKTEALYYHYNPGSLKEVFFQAQWTAKRKYKFGKLGKIYAFIRVNPIFSLLIGIYKGIREKELFYPVFKLVYDSGFLVGLLEKKSYA